MKILKLVVAQLLIFLMSSIVALAAPQDRAKNVIILIGDGMGPQQIALAALYAKHATKTVVKNRKLNIERLMDLGETGLVINKPATGLVIDSACSATQIATGQLSDSEMIGLDREGKPIETILEMAKNNGLSTGLVSDTRLTHATPASFAAHVAHRSMENEIAEQMILNDVDVMLSGGLRHFLPEAVNDKNSDSYKINRALVSEHISVKSKRKDNKDLLALARSQGYKLAFERKSMQSSKKGKLLGLFTNSGMPNGIINTLTKNDLNRKIPTLKEMTETALNILSKNKKGFFLMVEGGQIDWAGHQNDAGTMLHEMLKFDEAIGYVLDWAKKRKDTLVVLTADHETGSFGFSYNANNVPAKGKRLSGEGFKRQLFKPNYNFAKHNTLDNLYSQTKSFANILDDFYKENEKAQTAEKLQAEINKHSYYKISLAEAKAVMTSSKNKHYHAGHKTLGKKEWTHMDDFGAFYVSDGLRKAGMIARALSEEQSVVWGTGSHTSTPVVAVAYGSKKLTEKFDGLLYSGDIGKLAIDAFGFKRTSLSKRPDVMDKVITRKSSIQ